ncbi:hypothetical protein V8Z80_04835 [Orrella sp. JC864]|uniref:hypothetical protein n=1 Tax=Orrella sp. JC864 TaxID=3120298 RepID=UPI00300891B2
MADLRHQDQNELENKATQLRSLLSICFGVGHQAFDGIGDANREGIMWLAYSLAEDIERIVEGGNHD